MNTPAPDFTELRKEVEEAERKALGSRKGAKFLTDGVSIDDYDDEIAEMFGYVDDSLMCKQ